MKNWIFKTALLISMTFSSSFILAQSSPNPAELAKPLSKANAIQKAKSIADKKSPEVIKVGIYLNDVQSIDMRANNYLLDFYIWFKWTNPDLDPSATFEFMNHSESWATIKTTPTEKPDILADGSFYQVIHVQGRMSEKMDLRAYPFDKQNLVILIEDAAKDAQGLVYEVEDVSINPALKIPGFEFKTPTLTVSNYTYPTNFGDPRMLENGVYSRLDFQLPIYRNVLTSFVKNILPIWLAIICGVFALMLNPKLIDSRFQIAIFSILSLVALQISNGNDLPALQYMNLMDALYVTGYVFLICLMAELIIATKWIEHPDPEMDIKARRLDSIYGVVACIIFFSINCWFIFVTYANH